MGSSTWEIAFKRARERLDAREQTLLDELSVSKKENLPTSILVEAQRAQQDKDHRKWKYKRSNGQVVVFRDRFDGAVRGIATFANIVGIAINHSPEVTALVWASIRFLLQVRDPDRNFDHILIVDKAVFEPSARH